MGAVLLLSLALLAPNFAAAQVGTGGGQQQGGPSQTQGGTGTTQTPGAPASPQAQSATTGAGANTGQINAGLVDGDEIYGKIGYQILSLFAKFTGVAGVLLNAVVYYTVVKMGDFVNSMPAILTVWGILRDLGNIALIFGFIAIGVATILDVQSYNAKKMLVKLILVAVTVNFSLFAARMVIDVGNVFAYQFYTQMVTPTGAAAGESYSPAREGVSNAIMQMVGLQQFYSPSTIEAKKTQVLNQNALFAFIFGSLLFIVTAFVMLAFSFMLIARFVILVFLMILSPLGFVGFVIPTLEGQARKWWSTLIAQTATAPAVLLLFFITVTLMRSPKLLIGDKNLDAIFTSGTDVAQWAATAHMIIGFLIAMGMLMASLMLAKQMGAVGASFSIGMSRRITGAALSPISAPSRAMGNWAGRRLANFGGNAYERSGAGSLVRKIPLVGSLTDESLAGLSTKVGGIKFDGKSHADRQKEIAHRKHEVSVEDSIAKLRRAARANDDTAVGQLLQKMGSKDVAKAFERMGKGERASLARSMSVEAYTAILKDDKIDDGTKHDLAHDRYASLAGAPAANDKKEVRRWSAKDIAEYAKADPDGFARLVNTADLLSDEQREYLEKSDALTPLQREAVKATGEIGAVKKAFAELEEELAKPVGNQNAMTIAALRIQIRNQTAAIRGAKDKAKVGRKVLLSNEGLPALDVQTFQSLLEGKEMDAQHIDDHTDYLLTLPNNDPLRESYRNYYRENPFSRSVNRRHAQI